MNWKSKLKILFIAVIGIFIFGCSKEVELAHNESIENIENTEKTSTFLESLKTSELATNYTVDTLVEEKVTVQFGEYPQSDVTGEKKEPIRWTVLEKKDNKVLLFSKDIIDCKSYNNEYKDVTWENCDLRKWLNDDFYNIAFNNNEKDMIVETNLINEDNSEYKTPGGNNTYDKVFCLSENEIRKYFGSGEKKEYNSQVYFEIGKDIVAKGTEYAKNVDNYGNKLYVFSEESKSFEDYFGCSSYWLRSPGYFQNCAASVSYTGTIDISGIEVGVTRDDFGVRPAIWIKLK